MCRFVLSITLVMLFSGWVMPPRTFGYEPEVRAKLGGQNCHPGIILRTHGSDSVMVATWSTNQPIDPKSAIGGRAKLTVTEIIKDSKQESENIKVGKVLAESHVLLGWEGQRLLVFGAKYREGYRYSSFRVPLTDEILDYVQNAPAADAPHMAMLAYLAKHFESTDQTVADDAFRYFEWLFEIKDIPEIRGQLSVEQLRKFLTNPETKSHRVGMYGFLLGFVGNETDIQLLREISLRPVEDFRAGADRLFEGYLMLAGAQGLEVLEEAKLKNKTLSVSETYAMMQALRYLWTFGDDRISKDRLRQSMRILLDRPEMADLVIIDLCKWQDWSVSDRLMELYGTAGYDIPSTKQVIARFFLTAEAAKPKDANEPLPAHVLTAQKHLKTLREKDPETVKAAEEFFLRFPEFLGG